MRLTEDKDMLINTTSTAPHPADNWYCVSIDLDGENIAYLTYTKLSDVFEAVRIAMNNGATVTVSPQ